PGARIAALAADARRPCGWEFRKLRRVRRPCNALAAAFAPSANGGDAPACAGTRPLGPDFRGSSICVSFWLPWALLLHNYIGILRYVNQCFLKPVSLGNLGGRKTGSSCLSYERMSVAVQHWLMNRSHKGQGARTSR